MNKMNTQPCSICGVDGAAIPVPSALDAPGGGAEVYCFSCSQVVLHALALDAIEAHRSVSLEALDAAGPSDDDRDDDIREDCAAINARK